MSIPLDVIAHHIMPHLDDSTAMEIPFLSKSIYYKMKTKPRLWLPFLKSRIASPDLQQMIEKHFGLFLQFQCVQVHGFLSWIQCTFALDPTGLYVHPKCICLQFPSIMGKDDLLFLYRNGFVCEFFNEYRKETMIIYDWDGEKMFDTSKWIVYYHKQDSEVRTLDVHPESCHKGFVFHGGPDEYVIEEWIVDPSEYDKNEPINRSFY